MSVLKLAALGAAGFAAYRIWRASEPRPQAAFATGQGAAGNRTQVRDAGPEAMRDPAQRRWTKVDENSDQSFPASDPPATY